MRRILGGVALAATLVGCGGGGTGSNDARVNDGGQGPDGGGPQDQCPCAWAGPFDNWAPSGTFDHDGELMGLTSTDVSRVDCTTGALRIDSRGAADIGGTLQPTDAGGYVLVGGNSASDTYAVWFDAALEETARALLYHTPGQASSVVDSRGHVFRQVREAAPCGGQAVTITEYDSTGSFVREDATTFACLSNLDSNTYP